MLNRNQMLMFLVVYTLNKGDMRSGVVADEIESFTGPLSHSDRAILRDLDKLGYIKVQHPSFDPVRLWYSVAPGGVDFISEHVQPDEYK